MTLSIQLHLSGLSLSNTVRVREVFGGQRARSTVHNGVHKPDVQPNSGESPDHVAVDETVIRLNDEQHWLYAAVGPETNDLRHTTLEPTTTTVIAQPFLAETDENPDVSEAVFRSDGPQSFQAACHRAGDDCGSETHGSRTAVERVFDRIAR